MPRVLVAAAGAVAAVGCAAVAQADLPALNGNGCTANVGGNRGWNSTRTAG